RGQVDVFHELLIFVSADVGEAFDLPRHHGTESILNGARGSPVIEGHRLPCLVPRELADGNRRRGRADVRSEREQVRELLEKPDVPGFGLRNGELRERRIRVDEYSPGNT